MDKFNNLRHFREFKGYSQNYVARKIGKSQSALSKIENGFLQISDDLKERLSDVLGATKEKLFSNEPLILEYNFNDLNIKDFKEKIPYESGKETLSTLKNSYSKLLLHLAENERLLHKIDLNQKQIQHHLKRIL